MLEARRTELIRELVADPRRANITTNTVFGKRAEMKAITNFNAGFVCSPDLRTTQWQVNTRLPARTSLTLPQAGGLPLDVTAANLKANRHCNEDFRPPSMLKVIIQTIIT